MHTVASLEDGDDAAVAARIGDAQKLRRAPFIIVVIHTDVPEVHLIAAMGIKPRGDEDEIRIKSHDFGEDGEAHVRAELPGAVPTKPNVHDLLVPRSRSTAGVEPRPTSLAVRHRRTARIAWPKAMR